MLSRATGSHPAVSGSALPGGVPMSFATRVYPPVWLTRYPSAVSCW